MRVIEVLGPGCNNCLRLELEAAKAVEKAGVEAEIHKVSDTREILRYGVLSTPGLVIDGVVASTGRVPRFTGQSGLHRLRAQAGVSLGPEPSFQEPGGVPM